MEQNGELSIVVKCIPIDIHRSETGAVKFKPVWDVKRSKTLTFAYSTVIGFTPTLSIVSDIDDILRAQRFTLIEVCLVALAVMLLSSFYLASTIAEPVRRLAAAVHLTATPGSGWFFAGWSGDTTAVSNPLAVPMNRDRAVTATFRIPILKPSAANFVPYSPSLPPAWM